MFDTMVISKVVGGVGGALLVFLLGSWAADALYDTEVGGHGGEHAVAGYTVDTGEGEAVEEEEVVEVGFADIYAAADAAAGEKVFKKCKACHKLTDGDNATGPFLFGVVGRDVASIEGFRYSDNMTAKEGDWTPEALSEFLENPKGVVAGTKMSFKGLSKPETRADLIAYLATIGG
jgi:cytochrome c